MSYIIILLPLVSCIRTHNHFLYLRGFVQGQPPKNIQQRTFPLPSINYVEMDQQHSWNTKCALQFKKTSTPNPGMVNGKLQEGLKNVNIF